MGGLRLLQGGGEGDASERSVVWRGLAIGLDLLIWATILVGLWLIWRIWP